jgi:ribulose-5-phosphate 4-epimerase/fuculose-1-phosphate aldolase
MRLGTVGLVPYAPPGSKELFALFTEHVKDSDGYLLKNHGPVVGAKDLMSAFACIEELEESARIAWELRHENAETIE